MRRTSDRLALLQALAQKPDAFDFFQALRRLESEFRESPRIGTAAKVTDESVRMGQEPALDFAPATLTKFKHGGKGGVAKLSTRFFGLFGPNGALPLYLTEYARNPLTAVPEKYARQRYGGNRTRPSAAPLVQFTNLFHHRFLSLFYRAWAQAQPTVNLDRPETDRFADYLGALIGIGHARLRERDAVPDRAKLFFVGQLSRQARNAEGLEAITRGFFRVPVRVEQFVGHWMQLQPSELTQLGYRGLGSTLSQGVILGTRVWDRQHKIRLVLGPLDRAQYESFLPDGANFLQLRDWMRTYLTQELFWDAHLTLKRTEVPRVQLGRVGQLGWTSWMGHRQSGLDAHDLVLDCELASARKLRNVNTSHSTVHTKLKVAA